MHRTQILLEEWQYEALRARAEREGRSISELVRAALEEMLAPEAPSRRRLEEIEGIGEDAAACGRDHDRFLYGGKDGD